MSHQKTKPARPVCAALGIDVAADKVDLCALDANEKVLWKFPCEKAQYASLVRKIVNWAPTIVVVEATGGYEKDLLARLWLAGVPVRVVKPSNVRYFAKAIDQLTKTDALDAHVLALYALRNKVTPQTAPTERQVAIRQLCDRRQQLLAMSVQEQNRAKMARHAAAKKSISTVLKTINSELAKIDAQLDDHFTHDPEFREKEEILTSIPGVGTTTARVLLATVPELGELAPNAAAKIVGLAPFTRQSGKHEGKATIGGDRAVPRTALFLAAMAAIRFNPPLKTFYLRLCKLGKPPMLALTACMRKLLLLANTLLKKKQQFLENFN